MGAAQRQRRASVTDSVAGRRTLWTAIVIVGVFAACFDPKQACGNTIIRDAPSPDGRRRAVSFYRSCGTLSHERVGVSVLPVGAPLANEDGNVFVYTDTLGYAGRSDTLPTLADMQVEWTGPNDLRIKYVAIDRRPTGSGTPSSVQIGPPRQEIQQFQTLSVPERLTIYNARYDRSGHPPDTRLAGAFKDKPAETFDAIVADLPAGDFDRFMRYW